MKEFIYLLLIGISLSMDAFSLSLVFGLTIKNNKDKLLLSIIVSIYHFIMPLIGLLLSNILLKINYLDFNTLSSIILIYVGIETIISKEDHNYKINIISFLLFGLSVSIDSLTIGIGLRGITNKYLLSSILFSITSFIFTITGLHIGNYIGKIIQKYSKIIGGIILIII